MRRRRYYRLGKVEGQRYRVGFLKGLWLSLTRPPAVNVTKATVPMNVLWPMGIPERIKLITNQAKEEQCDAPPQS